MNTGTITARRAREIAALACLAGLTLVGCGTYRAGQARDTGPAGHVSTTGHASTTGQAGTTRSGRPVPASAVPRLKAIVKHFAKLNGGHTLTEATAVLTTHRKALTSATPGDFVAGSGGVPVYLVTMRGHFTVDASTPLGGQAPTGRYASLVLDTRSFDGLDMGLHQNPPPVSPESLGPVTDLLLPPAGTSS